MVDAASVAARARAAAGPDGRLPLPDLIGWDTFPFEGDLLVKRLDDPVLPEPPRHGEDGAANCAMCTKDDDGYVWVGDRWRLTVPIAPVPVPALLLEPRAHLDLADLDDTMAAELGVLAVRLARAMEAEPGVGHEPRRGVAPARRRAAGVERQRAARVDGHVACEQQLDRQQRLHPAGRGHGELDGAERQRVVVLDAVTDRRAHHRQRARQLL